eukprot:1160414-Pelagomonas_calceolata.AAC.11
MELTRTCTTTFTHRRYGHERDMQAGLLYTQTPSLPLQCLTGGRFRNPQRRYQDEPPPFAPANGNGVEGHLRGVQHLQLQAMHTCPCVSVDAEWKSGELMACDALRAIPHLETEAEPPEFNLWKSLWPCTRRQAFTP